MKELEITFEGTGEVKGYSFLQLNRNSKGYIYEVSNSFETHYEVFQRKENHQYNVVSYPKSNAFGVWAWTCLSKETAINKFNNF